MLTDAAAFDELDVLYRNAPLGLALFTRDGRWVRINARLAEINGHPVDVHIGASVDDLLPDLADELRRIWQPVLERGENIEGLVLRGETPAQPGVSRTWLTNYYPVKSAGGEITGILALVSEQTALAQGERRVTELEAQLELALSASGIDTWSWNLSTSELQRSPASLLALGYSESQAADREFLESRIHPDDLNRILSAYESHLKGHAPDIDVEYRISDVNDRWNWFRVRGRALETTFAQQDFIVAGTYENINAAKLDAQNRELLRSLRLRLSYLHTANEMKEVTCAMIGRRLDADYVSYVSIDQPAQNVGLEPFWTTGRLPECSPGFIIADLPPAIRDSVFQGHLFIANNLETASPFGLHAGGKMLAERGVQAMLIIPHMRDLKMVAGVVIQQAQPFHWLDKEVDFVRSALTSLWDSIGRASAETDAQSAKDLMHHAGQLGGTAVFDFDYVADNKFVSPEFENITGCRTDSSDADCVDPFDCYAQSIHPDDAREFKREWQRARDPRGDGLCLHDHRIVHGNDEVRWVQFRGQNLFADDGSVRRWMGAINEVTDLRLETAKAFSFEHRYRLAGMVSFDTIWDDDKETHQCLWSPSIQSSFGYEPVDGLTSLSWRLRRVHKDERAHVQESYDLAKASGQDSWSMEYRFEKSDGSFAHVIDRCRFVRNKDGSVRRAVGVIRDLSDQRAAINRIQQQQRELERVSRLGAMGAMASTLAHELNQPLAAASNYLTVISALSLKGGDTQVSAGEMAGIAEKAIEQVQRAGAIIRKMRDFTLTGEITVERLNFHDLLERTIERVKAHPSAANLAFARPHPKKALMAMLDAVQIEQVISNLLMNAVEALHATPKATISIEVTTSGQKLVLTVLDNGPGLSDEMLRDIFLPFKSSKKHGLGLGLPICRTIVEAHGGHLVADQRPEGGAVFTMSLPLADG